MFIIRLVKEPKSFIWRDAAQAADEMDQLERVTQVARRTAQQMLKNGGEIYRAEEIVRRIGEAYGYDADVIAFTTGITMTLSERDGSRTCSQITRVASRTVDLARLERVNALSRHLCEGKLSLSEAEAELNAIDRMKRITRLQEIGAAGGSAGFFALMFGGNWFDLLAAGVCGALAKAVLGLLPDEDGMPVTSAVAGFMAAFLGHALSKYTGMGNVDRIIVSTLMPFLPGLAFTNGIRDGMNGDLISGNARIGDAITRAIVLAGGAGAGLWLWMRLTGGVL